MIETKPDFDLEELLANEIACGGILNSAVARTCDRPAELISYGHKSCRRYLIYPYKCLACWKIWYQQVAQQIMKRGYVRCIKCDEAFFTVEDFSDYRPF